MKIAGYFTDSLLPALSLSTFKTSLSTSNFIDSPDFTLKTSFPTETHVFGLFKELLHFLLEESAINYIQIFTKVLYCQQYIWA